MDRGNGARFQAAQHPRTDVRQWPGMRSEYSWIPPGAGPTRTEPGQVGVSFSHHRAVVYEFASRTVEADIAGGSVFVTGPDPSPGFGSGRPPKLSRSTRIAICFAHLHPMNRILSPSQPLATALCWPFPPSSSACIPPAWGWVPWRQARLPTALPATCLRGTAIAETSSRGDRTYGLYDRRSRGGVRRCRPVWHSDAGPPRRGGEDEPISLRVSVQGHHRIGPAPVLHGAAHAPRHRVAAGIHGPRGRYRKRRWPVERQLLSAAVSKAHGPCCRVSCAKTARLDPVRDITVCEYPRHDNEHSPLLFR